MVGEYQYIVNGVEIANTLNRFNLNYTAEEIFKHSVKGNDIYDGQTYCNDCAPNEEHFYTYLYDSNAQGGAVFDIKKTTQNGKETIRVIIGWSLREQKDTDPPLPNPSLPGGVYILEKQPYSNTPQSRTFTKSDCGIGGVGSTIPLTVPAGTYISYYSQADADDKAISYLNHYYQWDADKLGTCTYPSTAKSGFFTKNDCIALGAQGSRESYVVIAGKYTSTISQNDANLEAQADVNANGQSFANTNGYCYFMSKALTNVGFRKVCVAPKVGTIVYYSAPAGLFISYTSQADADLKAKTAGQDNANLRGTCN